MPLGTPLDRTIRAVTLSRPNRCEIQPQSAGFADKGAG